MADDSRRRQISGGEEDVANNGNSSAMFHANSIQMFKP
jgi:hypothetical protein